MQDVITVKVSVQLFTKLVYLYSTGKKSIALLVLTDFLSVVHLEGFREESGVS